MELKVTLFLFFLIASVIGLFIRRYLHDRSSRVESMKKLLLIRWRIARQERQWWYRDHQLFFDFYHPEYQRLWEVEIGAEALYVFHEQGILGRFAKHTEISWSDYKAEKNCFDSQKT